MPSRMRVLLPSVLPASEHVGPPGISTEQILHASITRSKPNKGQSSSKKRRPVHEWRKFWAQDEATQLHGEQ